MAREQVFSILTHENIYAKKISDKVVYDRKIKVYLTLPQYETNADTGILLINSGLGARPNARSFNLLRQLIADQHNFIVLQAEIFGFEFTRPPSKQLHTLEIINIKKNLEKVFTNIELDVLFPNNKKFSFEAFQELAQKKCFQLEIPVKSKESLFHFADMSFLQTVDLINALLNTINMLYEQNFKFNTKKIIAYGVSHGAYLSYMINAFFPSLLSLIIDNSAWVYPYALDTIHKESIVSNNSTITFTLEDFAYANKNVLKVIRDPKILNLSYLYQQFTNLCQILSYHGSEDELEIYENKYNFLKKVKNSKLYQITPEKIDGDIFTDTKHALGAYNLKLFQLALNDKHVKFEKSNTLEFIDKVCFATDQAIYEINYEDIFPKIYISEK